MPIIQDRIVEVIKVVEKPVVKIVEVERIVPRQEIKFVEVPVYTDRIVEKIVKEV